MKPNSIYEMMVRFLLLLVTFLISIVMHGQIPPGLTFGGTENDIGYAICKTYTGGYLLAGTTRTDSTVSDDMSIIRIGCYNDLVWEKQYGWKHQDIIRSVVLLKDGFLLLGSIWDGHSRRSDIYLLKIDNHGDKIFEQFYGTPSRDAGHTVIAAADGGFIILAYTRGIEPRGDFLLIKTDSLGNELWRQNYGSDMDDIAFGLHETKDGKILILGSTGTFYYDINYTFRNHDADMLLIQTDSVGQELWRKTYGEEGHDLGYCIKAAPAGGYFLFGSSQSFGAGSFDMLLMKIDEEGNEEWHKLYGGKEYEYGLSMDVNSDGDLFLFGTTKTFGYSGSADYYLLKTKANGDIIWQTTIGGNDADFGQAVVATTDSGCAMIGSTTSFGAGKRDFLFVKVDKDGVIESLLSELPETTLQSAIVYPNPTSLSGRVKLDTGINGYRIDIIAMNGSLAKSAVLQSPDYEFSVAHLPAGLYFYRISSSAANQPEFRGKLLIH